MTTTCQTDHATVTTRYCPQCGAKVAQPILDLRAHLHSQATKAGKRGNRKSQDKWCNWMEALDKVIEKAELNAPTATARTSG